MINFNDLLTTTIAQILSSLGYFILIVWGFWLLSKKIEVLGEKVPEWITTYHRNRMEEMSVAKAIQWRNSQ